MIVERDIDCGALYELERQALLALVRALDGEQLRTTVPATPAWTVRDVVAHVVGIAADLNAGDLGRGDPDAWTAHQVASRAGRSIDELAREWDVEAPTFEDGLRLFGYETGSHFVGDLLQHVADVHQALGLPWRPSAEAVEVALDFYLDSFHHTLVDAGVGSVAVEVDGERVRVGSGPEVATVSTSRVELLRALGGRRSERQIRALHWSGGADRVVALVSRYGVPAGDLSDG